MNQNFSVSHQNFSKNVCARAAIFLFAGACVFAPTRLSAQTNKQNSKKNVAAATEKSRNVIVKTTAAAKTSQTVNSAANSYIVNGIKVFVRQNPSTTSDTIGQLEFGKIVRSLERGENSETIAGKNGFWHKIKIANDTSGWVFGGFLQPFNQTNREKIYQQIAGERFKSEKRSFEENAQLYNFLTGAQSETKTARVAADIGLWRLLALKSALAAIPVESLEKPPYKDFTDANKLNIVYSEPGAAWFVRSDRFWSLSKRYETLPVGERAAWAAANNPLPGECEGYLNCYLYVLRQTHAEYLQRFPTGAHAAESLKAIGAQLQPIIADASKKEIYNAPSDVSDRAEFYKTITELRDIVSRIKAVEKEQVLGQLSKIAESYR